MPLSSDDCIDILRNLQAELGRIDPEAQALIVEYTPQSPDPRRYLLDYLRSLIKILSERSAGAHGRVLNLLNAYIHTSEGRPIQGLILALTETERTLYQRDQINLAMLPDNERVVSALRELYEDIRRDLGEPDGRR